MGGTAAEGKAMAGRAVFTETRLDGGLVRYNYTEPWSEHFIWQGRGDSVEGRQQWRMAWLRRELRGLVLHESGEGRSEGFQSSST